MIVFDLIAYGFASLIVFTFLGVILSFVIYQAESLKHVWFQPEQVTFRSLASPWSRMILDGSALRPFRAALLLCQRDPALAGTGYRRIVVELDKLIAELKIREPNALVRKALYRELTRLRAVYSRKQGAAIVKAKTREVRRERAALMRAG
jgi:hypothetical protein